MSILSSLVPVQRKVAIDLGTAFIRVATKDFGWVTMATGQAARPPLREGVVVDPYEVASLLRPLLSRARRFGVAPGVAVGIPAETSFKERRALHVAMCAAGADEVEVVAEPQAAAIGAGLELDSPYAHMIVDIGEGVTDCAIIRGGGILYASTIRIGCGTLREQIQTGYRQRWGIDLPRGDAERLLEGAGVGDAAGWSAGNQPAEAGGKTAAPDGTAPSTIHAFVDPGVAGIVESVNDQLRDIPHDLGCEIIEAGIVLTGGGALLPGMRERLQRATAISVTVPRDPLDTVIKGLTHMLDLGTVRRR
jgi:rod shape-determining protein MreB